MSQPKLVFTADKTKVSGELSPKIRKTFTMLQVAAALTDGHEGCATAREGEQIMQIQFAIARKSNPNAEEPDSHRLVSMIAERFPDMRLSAMTILLLSSFSTREEHVEILAASLAWASLRQPEPISVETLTLELLPEGYPSSEYLDELVEYYRENPDLLWPPDLVVENI